MASILLAEDDMALRGFLKSALEKNGHEIDAAEDGAQAYALLKEGRQYDLLLTDIVMPNMDGFELSQQIKKISPLTPVMFITGFAGLAADQIEQNQNAMVISKPFHLKDIINQVNTILVNKPLQNDT